MYDLVLYEAVLKDQQRRVAWADRHAWKVDQVHEQQRRQRRARVARFLVALAARLEAVDAGPAGEARMAAAEHGA